MVSIVIPCFNGEKFINRCFNSILNQSYNNIEVILVNDGSVDKSEEIIKLERLKFKEKNIKFKYIYQQNKGAGGAINSGLKHVTGKYLTLLDIDDYLMPNSIEEKVRFLEDNKEYDIVRTNGYYVSEENLNNETNLFVVNDDEKNNIYIFDDLIEAKTNNWAGSYMLRSSKLFEFYKDRNIYESKYGQNLQLLLPLAYKGKSGFIDKPLMKYIRQENSLSQLKGDFNLEVKNLLGYKQIRKHMLNIILSDDELNKYLERLEIVYAKYLMNLAFYKKDIKLLKENYIMLKKYKANDIEYKILYYNATNKILCLFFRVMRKVALVGERYD
ncbi:glycosyltransferase family A protein [Clostridium celatum]|uniref:Glycosyltransferase, group 2 family protein n=1 Tax=Clostridium celatum DSM 1785 TaxID=545697 RepID=L1QM14_9CLOT|nr:glycosyltransferase family A protein [Clostridium celatum]EKY29013.1 glycosyltransferase, group 2 family protein [Clostridium celatum DSM 1785]MCE9654425.1 glycosyltransferase family 2 protein [Clostridium celatum]